MDGLGARGAGTDAGADQPVKEQRTDPVRARSNRQNGLFVAAGG